MRHHPLVLIAAFQVSEEVYYAYLKNPSHHLDLRKLSNAPNFPSLHMVFEIFKLMGYNLILPYDS